MKTWKSRLRPFVERWRGRASGILSVTALLLLAVAPFAFADTGVAVGPLSWIDLQDTQGISVWNHELSLDRGNGFPFNPEKFFWSAVTDFSWNYYRNYCVLVLWFLDWVLRLEWVGVVSSPLLDVGDALQQVVTSTGLVPTFLTITAVVAGLWMLRGRLATGLWDVVIACIISALAVGVFAQPVRLVAGPDGYIVHANTLGQEIAASLATGDAKGRTPAELRRAQTGQLVDVFIRQPLQMINYGAVLDGGSCEATYNEALKGGPYGGASTIRDKVAGCDKKLGDYAAAPSANMAGSALIFQPAGFIILIFSVVLAGSVVAAGIWAMYQAVHAIWALVSGILPGGSRGSILSVVAEIFVALVIIVFTNVYLSVFLLVVDAMFKGSDNPARTFVIVDVILVVGILVFVRKRAQIKGMAQRIAQWMAWRPGSPTRLPGRPATPNPLGSVIRTVANVGQLGAQMAANRRPPGAGGPTFVDARQQAVYFAAGAAPAPQGPGGYAYQSPPRQQPVVVPGEVVDAGPNRPELPPGGSGGALPGGSNGPTLPGSPTRPALPPGPGPAPVGDAPPPSPRVSRAQRAKQVGGTLLRAGTNAALGYVTGGASTVARAAASKAGGVVRAARRTALVARMTVNPTNPKPAPRSTPPRRRTPPPTAGAPTVTGRVLDPLPPPPQPASEPADQLRQRLADRSRRRPDQRP